MLTFAAEMQVWCLNLDRERIARLHAMHMRFGDADGTLRNTCDLFEGIRVFGFRSCQWNYV